MDLIGQVFGKLTVLARESDYIPSKGQRRRQWQCACACGATTVVRTGHLRSGAVRSCGCGRKALKHGLARSSEYRIWTGMRQRCENSNHPEYKNYGGRGISVSPEWLSFTVFYEDMGPRPSAKHELDRIDNNGNYQKGNVRWATRTQQCANTRKTVLIEVSPGEFLPREVAAKKFGLSPSTLRYRLRSGWDTFTALNAEPGYSFKTNGQLTR